MKRLRKPALTRPALMLSTILVLLLVLFQNMSLVEFAALNMATINEPVRRHQAREFLGEDYRGSFAQKLEGQEFLNFLVYKKLRRGLGPNWESRISDITRVLIAESQANQFDPVFILAVIQTESQFNASVVGTAGEIGLMQIKPSTAEWIANRDDVQWLGRESLFDPAINIKLGIRYFAHLRTQFEKSATHYVPAYNMGPTNLRRLERNIASTGVDLRVVKPEYATRVLRNYNEIYRQMALDQTDLDKFALAQ